MSLSLTARPTTYKGIKMRSRLEAKYAASLDRSGHIVWAYEPRAYANSRAQYLPDFEILQVGGVPVEQPMFIEVRPTLERGYLAMSQMSVIWDSEPDAELWISVPSVVLWCATHPERVWRVVV